MCISKHPVSAMADTESRQAFSAELIHHEACIVNTCIIFSL